MMAGLTPIGTSRGLTIEDLKGISSLDIIKTVIDEQIKVIDDKIRIAHASGLGGINHEMPSNFALGNLEKKDAQLLVYSELVNIYRRPVSAGGKGFVNTTIDAGMISRLCIHWHNGMTDEEREQRKRLLSSAKK